MTNGLDIYSAALKTQHALAKASTLQELQEALLAIYALSALAEILAVQNMYLSNRYKRAI